jgi:EmrB/QacA subfamily drug resistance transporter
MIHAEHLERRLDVAKSWHGRWTVLAVASIGTLPVTLDSSLNIAFPAISTSFHLTVSLIQWLVIAYVLTTASLLLGCGRLADIAGRKKVFCIGLIISTLALTLCGFAPSYPFLLAFRVLQGVAAALISSTAPAIVAAVSAPNELGWALGILNMIGFFGQTSGPIAGGYLTERFSWRGVFLFRVPITLTAFSLALPVVCESAASDRHQEFDVAGAVMLALSVAGFLLVLNYGRSRGYLAPQTLMLAFGAVILFAGFIYSERRASQPIIDRSMLTPGLILINLANLLANLAMFAIWLLVPYYIVDVLHYPAASGGTLLAPCPLGMALAAPVAGHLTDRIEPRIVQVLGLAGESLGLFLVSKLGTAASYGSVVLALAMVGLGLGSFIVANTKSVMSSLAPERQGVAAGIVAMMRTMGVVAGVSSAAAVFSHRQSVHAALLSQAGAALSAVRLGSFVGAFHDAFNVSTAVCIGAMLLAMAAVPPIMTASGSSERVADAGVEAS